MSRFPTEQILTVSFQECIKMFLLIYLCFPYEESLECIVSSERSTEFPMLTVETICIQDCHQLECIDFVSILLWRQGLNCIIHVVMLCPSSVILFNKACFSLSALTWQHHCYKDFNQLREINWVIQQPGSCHAHGAEGSPLASSSARNFTRQILLLHPYKFLSVMALQRCQNQERCKLRV